MPRALLIFSLFRENQLTLMVPTRNPNTTPTLTVDPLQLKNNRSLLKLGETSRMLQTRHRTRDQQSLNTRN
jgi:hypothetical protein